MGQDIVVTEFGEEPNKGFYWEPKEAYDMQHSEEAIAQMKQMEQDLFWGTSKPPEDRIVFCYIDLIDGRSNELAMYNVTKDVMYKMKEGASYERTNETYKKEEYTFRRYATLMDI